MDIARHLNLLYESPSGSAGIAALADGILRQVAPVFNDFPAVLPDRNIKTGDPDVDWFLQDRASKIPVEIRAKEHGRGGVYTTRKELPPTIVVFVPKEKTPLVGTERVYSWLQTFASKSLVHELTHAYDDYRSQGDHRKSRKSRHSQSLNRKYNSSYSTATDEEELDALAQRADAAYLRDPIEVNARYEAAVARLLRLWQRPEKPLKTFADFRRYFSANFRGWDVLAPAQQQRILKRLTLEWNHLREQSG